MEAFKKLNFICRMLFVSKKLVIVILVPLKYLQFLEQFLHPRINIMQQRGSGVNNTSLKVSAVLRAVSKFRNLDNIGEMD
jgi:accessory colonization factor AcfC